MILFTLKHGYSQTSYLSYPQQLCLDDLYKPISICLNDNIAKCESYCQSVNLPQFFLSNDFTFFVKPLNTNLSPIAQITSKSNNDISKWCTQITFSSSGNYVFELYIERKGWQPYCGINSPINNTCHDTLFIGSIIINISNSNLCNNYIEDTICNLIKNASFEDYVTCPNYNSNNVLSNIVDHWIKPYSNSFPLFFNLDCNNLQISRNEISSNFYHPFPSVASQPFPSGRGIIGCGYNLYSIPLSHAQNLNLCNSQKYKFSFYCMRAKNYSLNSFSNIGIYTGNGTLPLAGNFTTTPVGFNKILEIPITDFTNYFNWHQFSYTFTNIGNTNAFIFQNTQSINSADLFFDNLSLIPVDTVIFNTQLIGNRCDSAEMILNIPGCYGPYNLDVVVNSDTIHYNQVQDGHTVKIPLAKNNVVKVLSITNSLGCATILNTSDTLIVNNSGDASFTSTDFCEGQTNTITFLGDTGIFSLVNNTTSATINPNTGIINGAQGGDMFIISHAVCLDTVYDTIQCFKNSAMFTSSDICVGSVNTISITGTTGGIFSLLPPTNGATINASTGVISGATLGNSYTIKYKVGNPCPDSLTQTIQVVAIEDPSFVASDFCINATNSIVVTGSQNGVFSFSPSPTDGATINNLTGIISNATAGNSYSVKYVTSGLCKDSSTQVVNSLSIPTVSLTSSGGDLCGNDSVPITLNFTGNSPWSITYTDGTNNYTLSNITSTPYTIYAKTLGTYKVISVADNQCSNNINPSEVTITGDSVEIFSSTNTGCEPQEVKFWSNVNGLNGDCVWSFGDGSNDVNICDTVTHTYQLFGSYTVKLEVESSKCKKTVIIPNFIDIKPNPTAIFYFTPQNPSVLNNTVVFTNSSINNIQNIWTLNSNITDTIINPTIKLPATIGNHEVCLVVMNNFNCYDTICKEIYVLDESLFYIPNAFVPNNDGLNDIFKPVISNASNYNFKIFNRWGKLIFETNDYNEGWDGTYKGSLAENGVYTYRMTYRFKGNYDDQYLTGHFTLLR